MDAMALLCMLHADGPSTLKSLRRAGCSSLESIEGMEEERLSKLLGGPPAAARRFAREARHLRERLGADHPAGGILDREESVVETLPPLGMLGDVRPPMTDPVAADPVAADFVDVDVDGDGAEEEASVAEESEAADPYEEALEAWRALDQEDADLAESAALPSEPRARPEYEFGSELSTAIRELAGSASPAAQETSSAPPFDGTRLVPGGLDGLDPELCLELAAAGFETVESLAESDPLRLSEMLGIAYGKLWRLGCLARRTLVASAAAPASAIPVSAPVLRAIPATDLEASPVLEKLSPSERPWKPVPSILELEWNREIRPQAPPPGHAVPYATDITPDIPAGRAHETDERERETAQRERDTEGAGGPFV